MGPLAMDRRVFLGSLPAICSWSAWSSRGEPDPFRRVCGRTLSGWETIVGDGVYACPGEPPVGPGDIAAIHGVEETELQANVAERAIMAHNLTFLAHPEPSIVPFHHTATCWFRLYSLPSFDHPAQTLEAHLAVWDGRKTRLDYITGLQWLLNAWDVGYGSVRAWVPPGEWQHVGHLEPDILWHSLSMTTDRRGMTSAVVLDGTTYYADLLTAMQRPEDWGKDVTARFGAEIISVYPGAGCQGRLHRAAFKNWCWDRRRP